MTYQVNMANAKAPIANRTPPAVATTAPMFASHTPRVGVIWATTSDRPIATAANATESTRIDVQIPSRTGASSLYRNELRTGHGRKSRTVATTAAPRANVAAMMMVRARLVPKLNDAPSAAVSDRAYVVIGFLQVAEHRAAGSYAGVARHSSWLARDSHPYWH